MEGHDSQEAAESAAPAQGPSAAIDDDMFETEDESLRRALQMSMGVGALSRMFDNPPRCLDGLLFCRVRGGWPSRPTPQSTCTACSYRIKILC